MLKKIVSIPKKFIAFIGSILAELRLMEWLSFKNVIRSTALVIAISAAITIFIIITDAVLTNLRVFFLTRGTI